MRLRDSAELCCAYKSVNAAKVLLPTGRGHLPGRLLRVHLPGDDGVLGGVVPRAEPAALRRESAADEHRVRRAAPVGDRPVLEGGLPALLLSLHGGLLGHVPTLGARTSFGRDHSQQGGILNISSSCANDEFPEIQ